jgi:uncharacterized membrane protein YfcA
VSGESCIIVAVVAFLASMINAAAGGGSFLSFPTLLALGVPPVTANATNNFAMWMGNITMIGGSYRDLDIPSSTLVKLFVVSLAGGLVGAVLLLHTGNVAFSSVVPFLLLGATLVYFLGPSITERVESLDFARPDSLPALFAQFAIAVYGGFFGAAQGILTLALLNVLGMHDARKASALKNVLVFASNGIACIPYVAARLVHWPTAVAMGLGALAGGYVGSHVVRRLPASLMRGVVLSIASAMTVFVFWKYTFMHG